MEKVCTNVSLKTINDDMSYLCANIKSTCTYAHKQISVEIQKIDKNFSDKNENNYCVDLQRQCYFLEHYDPFALLLKCDKLREYCYNKVRVGAAEVILRKYLKGSSNDIDTCMRKLKLGCRSLSKQSPELLDLCINGQNACEKFVEESKKKCQNFENELSKQKISQNICSEWLKECYTVVPNCPSLYNSCRLFQDNCAENGFFYDVLHDLNLDLFKNPFEFTDIDVVEYGHHRLNTYGVFFSEIPNFSNIILTNILVQKGDAEITYCRRILLAKCPLLDYLDIFKHICIKSKNYGSCINIYNANYRHFSSYIKKLTYSSSFSEKECQEYLPLCYFLSDYFDFWFEDGICRYIKINCYQQDIEKNIDITLLKGLNGNFTIKNDKLSHSLVENDCQTYLYILCAKIMYKNHYILYKCLHPKETCKKIVNLLEKKCKELDNILGNIQTDFTPSHCEKQEECNNLKSCSSYTLELCQKLKTYCENLDERKKLKLAMLANQTNLQTETACVYRLTQYCSQDNTSYVCTDIQYTCKHMHSEIQSDCRELLQFLVNYKNRYNVLTYTSYSHCSYFKTQCALYKWGCSFLIGRCTEAQKTCDDLIKQIKDFNVLAKALGEGISTIDKCEAKRQQKCTSHTSLGKTVLCNYSLKCSLLLQYLRKACDMLVLKGLKYYHTTHNSMTECKKVESLCSYIGPSCAGINDRVSFICSSIIVGCKTPSSEPLSPLEPGSQPPTPPELPPGPPPEAPPEQPQPSVPVPSRPEPGQPPPPGPAPKPPSESKPIPSPAPLPTPETSPETPQPPVPAPSKPEPKPKPESPVEPSAEPPSAPESSPKPKPEPELPESPSAPELPTPESPTKPESTSPPVPSPIPEPQKPTKSPSSSSATHLPKPRPTSSHDTRIIGAAIRSKELQRIELILTITAIILGLWIII
ncbi:hypothetical protein PMAC_003393 [Pneumocystis sp. 'macacae']|nr:hypothetical protein PMAC_003393 [Pneumocystis sp. 'macacae']